MWRDSSVSAPGSPGPRRRPVLRKFTPGRIRQRWRTRHAVRFVHYGPSISTGRATDYRSITFKHRDQPEYPVGKVSYLVCHECRRGFIGNIDVQKNFWGQGIATRALAEIRKGVPGYTWRTSLHLPGAKSFWQLMAERTGEDYTDTETDRVCEHMKPFWTGGATRAEASEEVPAWAKDLT
ncbi:hypothetical protein IU510_29645 [Nocardia cyriacigeorgica]|uniref:hypothetical protein n=1 Tax=Nocardia cyriacigeorgica TaxID=135487 RepID=UPI0018936BFB|nr:hypothetical protein [Nocardia cyriacigeorgica]MBF6102184.1 hypothetical protein [Nocardia cyriacigeorgica]